MPPVVTAALDVLDYPVAAPPPPGEVLEIAPGVLWLRMPLPFALDHINLWLLPERDGGCTLVDCGFGDPPTRALWERHIATTLRAMPIRRIVATHYHPDHVGNAAWLSRRFDAPVAMTHAEYLTAHAVAGEFGGHTTEATIDLFRRHGMAEADRAALAQARQSLPARRAGAAAIDRHACRTATPGPRGTRRGGSSSATGTRRTTRRSTAPSAAC